MILQGDALEELRKLPDKCCSVCVTSPPYYNARDYGAADQLGTESSPEEYTRKLVEAFREVARVLKDDGTLWLNIGDSYARHIEDGGIKRKDLIGIPWLLALALRSDGWYLRADIIWNKPNAMPESAKDRPARSHEYVFLLSKAAAYYYDAEAVKELAVGYDPKKPGRKRGNAKTFRGGTAYTHDQAKANSAEVDRGSHGLQRNETGKRNRRDVWTIATRPYKGAHLSTFPEELAKICILAGSKPGDTVLDPFSGRSQTMKRGEIYYIESTYRETGSEQRGGRPAVIVSNDKNNENSEVVEVVYMTTKPKNDLPTHVFIRSALSPSTVLCEQVNSVSVKRIGTLIGKLTKSELAAVDSALAISLGIDFMDPKPATKEAEHLLEEISKQPLRIVQQDPDVEKIKLETERDLYRNLYNELLSKTMKGASA